MSRDQSVLLHRTILIGAVPFLFNMGLLGFAMKNQVAVVFASLWLFIQISGYWLSAKQQQSSITKSLIYIHWLMMTLVLAMLFRWMA